MLPVALLVFAIAQDVKLPPGDPIPDFRERPWVPPNADPFEHNKRGTNFGPCIAFTVQLGPNDFVRRGLTIKLPDDCGVCYDTDQLAVAATWGGGFLDVSKTHFEDEKGNLAGRPGGPPTRWVFDSPGWANTKREELKYDGHFLNGFRVVLAYRVKERAVWEMPTATRRSVMRTFFVAPSETPLELIVANLKGTKEKLNADLFGKEVAIVEDAESVRVKIPASKNAIMFKLALWTNNPKMMPDKAMIVADLRNELRGGPLRWRDPIVTVGELGVNKNGYAVDSLTLPVQNPWKSWLRPAAIDFFSDGRLAMSSMNGDVWIVSGIDSTLKQLKWKRFATGLYEPLGVKIVDDKLYVLGRDRITRLHDLNDDGEADYYENFFSGGTTSPGYHAFSFDLQTDSKGNFYFVKSGRKADDGDDQNALVQVSPDGTKWQSIASGFRHPNGMGIGPDDTIVVSDNQGEFVPASKVSQIRKGGFYGYGTKVGPYERPLFWLPMSEDNSSGGQLWAPPKWGPMSGRMLHTSYGSCKMFYVLPQSENGETIQTSLIPFETQFPSGVMRGRVNPVDGQVYLSGLRGWGTAAKDDGCVNRVRFTGRSAFMVQNVELIPKGLRLTFSEPLNVAFGSDVKSYTIEQWNYLYSEKYGSPEFSVRDPKKIAHDRLDIAGVSLSDDGRVVTLDVPEMAVADQMKTTLDLRSRTGDVLKVNVFSTVHRLLK